jgi:hypothetical protein
LLLGIGKSAVMDHHPGTSTITTPARTESPSPDGEAITPIPDRQNPFLSASGSYANSPYGSNLHSARESTTGFNTLRPRYFQSRRINKDTIEKPWLAKENRDPREKWVWILPVIGLLLGFGMCGFLIYDGLQTVSNHTYCPVLDQDFSTLTELDPSIWQQEVELGGFG